MNLSKFFKNAFLVMLACLVLSACATKKVQNQIQGDVYTGTDTVEYLASGVPDRVFFATNESVLTTASRDTLRKQAEWLRKNSKINVVRFGNVFASQGSAINLFLEQINNGGPITITNKKVKRYFMSSNQAANLVLKGSQMFSNKNILILNMGNQIKLIKSNSCTN